MPSKHFRQDDDSVQPAPVGKHTSTPAEPVTTSSARHAAPAQPAAAVGGRHAAPAAEPAAASSTRRAAAPATEPATSASAGRHASAPAHEAKPAGVRSAKAGSRTRAKRKRSPMRLLSTLLILIGVGLLLTAGGLWGHAQWRYYMQNKVNAEQQKYASVRDSAATSADDPGCPIEVDWAALKAINDDIVGWLYVPGTVINYPVYQGTDNDYYLRTTATGEWSVGGQVFMDYENTKPGLVDYQSVLYGHHLMDGTMFQPLTLLDNQETFDATDTIWYLTEEKEYELEPLLMYYTDPYDTAGVRRFKFKNADEFKNYLNGLLDRSVTRRADADKIIEGTQHVLTMSTCNYYEGYGRSILVAVPKDEARAALTGEVQKVVEEPPVEPEEQDEGMTEGDEQQDGEPEDEATEGGDEYYDEGYYDDGYYGEGYYDDGYYDDGYYDDGYYDDGYYEGGDDAGDEGYDEGGDDTVDDGGDDAGGDDAGGDDTGGDDGGYDDAGGDDTGGDETGGEEVTGEDVEA